MAKPVTGTRDTRSIVRYVFQLFLCLTCISLNYRDPEPFDWYQRYSGVRDLINQVNALFNSHNCVALGIADLNFLSHAFPPSFSTSNARMLYSWLVLVTPDSQKICLRMVNISYFHSIL